MTAPRAEMPPQNLGQQVRNTVARGLQVAAQRHAANAARFAARGERMHQHLAAAEQALTDLGTHVIHDFTTGNYQGAADTIRSAIENSVSRARQAGVPVSEQNTGGITRMGRP